MPNWCENVAVITGPRELILRIKSYIEENNSILQFMHPMPKELEDTTAPNESGINWYNWRVENWGTKWDVSDINIDGWDLESDVPSINLSFNSAWSPPVEAFDYFADNNEDVSFDLYYCEWGMMFCGWANTSSNEYYQIPETEQEVAVLIPSELDDIFNISYTVGEMAEENSFDEAS